jgi:hypothetical protein
MEYIKEHIGPNKITIEIKPNDFEETVAIDTLPNGIEDVFKNMDNMIEIFRKQQGTNTPKQGFVNPPSQQPIHDNLLFVLLSTTDPMLELHKNEEINRYVQAFKDDLIKNLVNMYKKLELNKLYSEDEIKTAIKLSNLDLKERKAVLVYFSRLVNKCIGIELESGEIIFNENNCSDKGIYIKQSGQKFEIEANDDAIEKEAFHKKIVDGKIKYYLKNNYVDKLDTLLVKDLKVIAEDLDLPTSKNDDGKKKPLLKNELKGLIKEKLK